MALILSTSNLKLNKSLICLTYQTKPQFTTLCSNSKLPMPKDTISKCLTLKTHQTPTCNYRDYSSNMHTHNEKKSYIRAKSSANSVPEMESKYHKIWWSDVEVKKPKNVFVARKWNSVDVENLSVWVIVHVLAVFGPLTFDWGAFWVAFVLLGIVTGMLGISLSYHRNLTHRSFKLPKWLEYTFAYCGVLALQKDPIFWVSIHRFHHQYIDSEQDPHSPIGGFWFSHVNWLFNTGAISKKCGEPSNVSDLDKQPFYRFIRSTYWLHPLLLGVLLYAFGGFPYLVWGMGVRAVIMFHMTFAINSVCHIWGRRVWNTADLSRNTWWVALLTFGEGWHNNHHAFEYSARLGLEWWQLDMAWYTIKLLEFLGLATDIKLPTEDHKLSLAIEK